MAVLSYAQLKAVWLQAAAGTQYATNEWASLMAAIAEAESAGNENAQNDKDNGGTQTSWGLWQISNGTHSEVSPNWNNPVINAQLAVQKLDDQGLDAWGTYTSGAYEAYLNGATTPDVNGITGGSIAEAAAIKKTNAAQANCLWAIGWGGIPGTSWLQDLFGGGGNVGSGEVCLFSKSQARGLVGAAMLVGGGIILSLGGSMIIVVMGLKGASRVIGVGTAAKSAAGKLGSLGGGTAAGGTADLAVVAA